MTADNKVIIRNKKLKTLISILEDKTKERIRIGIIGSSSQRSDDPSNAEIGVKHEFGLDGMPERSFLRMPLILKYEKALLSAGFLRKKNEIIKKALSEGGLRELFEKMAAIGKDVISEAFETGGYGFWKKSNMKYKKNKQTLVETTQLRDSISWEIKE